MSQVTGVVRSMTVFSKLKPADKFARKWGEGGLDGGQPEREYRFDSRRKWRFDFAWPRVKVAVEIDGRGYGHQSYVGVDEDAEKQNAAIELGWIVLRFTSGTIASHQKAADAVEQVCRVICGVKS